MIEKIQKLWEILKILWKNLVLQKKVMIKLYQNMK